MSGFTLPQEAIQEYKKRPAETVPFDSPGQPLPRQEQLPIGNPTEITNRESGLMPIARMTAGTLAGAGAAVLAAPFAATSGPYAPVVEAAAIAGASRLAQNMVDYAGDKLGLRPNYGPKPGLGSIFMRETVGLASETAAQLAGNAIGVLVTNRIISPLARSYFRQSTPALQGEALQAFHAAEQLGVPVEGMAHMVGGRNTAEFIRGLRSHPLYQNPSVNEAFDRTDEAIGKVWTNAINQYSPGGAKSPVQVGNIIKGGLLDGRKALGVWASAQEREIGDKFVKNEAIRLDNFLNAYRESADIFKVTPQGAKQAPEALGKSIVPQELGQWAKIIEDSNGSLTYEQVRALRTELRTRLNKPLFLKTPDDQKMMGAYSAINEDLTEAMTKRGLKGKWDQYNGTYRNAMAEFEAVESIADSNFAYEAFDALRRGDKRSGELLLKVKKQLTVAQLPPSAWNDVVALRLTELGEKKGAPAGTFDFSTFAKSMDNLDESAKRVLFDNPGMEKVSDQIDKLLIVARRRAASPIPDSGTPRGLEVHNFIRNPITYLQPMGFISGYSIGKLFTNRQFVKWLADGQGYAKMTGRGFESHLARLGAIAANDPYISGAIKEYYGAFKTGFKNDVPLGIEE